MPSFKLLNDGEVRALVDYVKYLSIRGEVETQLIMEAANELDPDQKLVDMGDAEISNPLVVGEFDTNRAWMLGLNFNWQ